MNEEEIGLEGISSENGHCVLRQASQFPIFKSKEYSEIDLNCQNCKHLLIDGYFEECFIDLSIQCFRCREITRTPELFEGEVLPVEPINVGGNGIYPMEGPVEYSREISVTHRDQIVINNRLCSPRKTESIFEISMDFIIEQNSRFCELSGSSCEERKSILNRYHQNRQSGALELPFDWAVWTLKKGIDAGILDVSDKNVKMALIRFYFFWRTDQNWKHHPRYEEISREYANPTAFFHTVGHLMLASIYYSQNLRTGFSIENSHGQRKTDLYIRTKANRKFHFEFKTPKSLIWRGSEMTFEEIRKNVKSILKNSGQIGKERPGAFVLMANYPFDYAKAFLDHEIRKILREQGLYKRSLAGVVLMSCDMQFDFISRKNVVLTPSIETNNIANLLYEDKYNPLVGDEDNVISGK